MQSSAHIQLGLSLDGKPVTFAAAMATRHGLIAGATGTGKTVTLQTLAQSFAELGVNVFTADVKGDLSGIGAPAQPSDKLSARLERLQLKCFQPAAASLLFWDIGGRRGHPLRTTVSEVGPLLLSRILELNETQSEVLQLVFTIADDRGLLLLDLKDLRELLSSVAENAKELKAGYGNITTATLGSIQRPLMTLAQRGGEEFFGEPALQIADLLRCSPSGKALVSVLDASSLLSDPLLYSTSLLWLLSELFEELPEVGDQPLPKLIFFFDEAHLLFRDAPEALLSKIEQVVRLVRSKGVGVYFVTQNPADVPEAVLAQLGNRIQHALRAYTPKEQKAVRAAAQSFRPNPGFDTEQVITQLEVGEALVSVLDEQGRPGIVERVLIAPPASRIGPLNEPERAEIMRQSPLAGQYEKAVDRQSAYEMLRRRKEFEIKVEPPPRERTRSSEPERRHEERPRSSGRDTAGEALLKSAARSIGSALGRQIVRGILGSFRR